MIQQGLVRQKKCHITNEEGRVIGRVSFREGRKHVLQLVNLTPPRYVYAETFESETIVEILKTADDELLIEVANYFVCQYG